MTGAGVDIELSRAGDGWGLAASGGDLNLARATCWAGRRKGACGYTIQGYQRRQEALRMLAGPWPVAVAAAEKGLARLDTDRSSTFPHLSITFQAR